MPEKPPMPKTFFALLPYAVTITLQQMMAASFYQGMGGRANGFAQGGKSLNFNFLPHQILGVKGLAKKEHVWCANNFGPGWDSNKHPKLSDRHAIQWGAYLSEAVTTVAHFHFRDENNAVLFKLACG